jgi:type II secretory pathway component PulF
MKPDSVEFATPQERPDGRRFWVLKPSAGLARLAIAIVWRITLGGMLALLVGVLWFGVSPVLAMIAPIVLIILIPVTAGAMRQLRRRRALVVLSYLEQATRLNLPLQRMLDAAQRSESGRVSRALTRLAALLDGGAPLGGALALSTPETPRRVISLVAAAERLGQLPATLHRVVTDERADIEADPDRQSFGRWYPILMTLALSSIVLTIMIFVIPKYEDIFRDFGLKLPPNTLKLLSIARFAAHGDVLPWLIILVLAGLALNVLGAAFRAIFDSGDPDLALAAARGSGSSDAWDAILWYLPIAHGTARDRGLADVCRTIADALRTGRPLLRAIDQATLIRTNAILHHRLVNWRHRMEQGLPADQAARDAGLPDLFAGMIGPAAATTGPGATAAFDFLADYYASRFSRARELLRAAAVPVLVFCFAAIVLFVILALFAPLVSMMDYLSQNVPGVR